MKDNLKKLVNKNNVHIPESFDKKFEETLKKLPDKSKSTYKKTYKFVASIALIAVIGTGAVIASNGKYKYAPTTGVIFDSEESVFVLDKTIVKKDNNGENVELDMFINKGSKKAVVTINGKYNMPKLEKSELKIGDKIYKNERQNLENSEGYTWSVVDIFENIKSYKEDDDIVYTIYMDDINKIDFDINLKEIDGVTSYNDLGITSTYNNIPITAVVNEYNEYMIVDFINPTTNYSIIPGIEGVDETFSGIYLLDANGTRINAKREVSGGYVRYNRVKIDTRNIQKPYKIVVPQIRVDLYNGNNIETTSEEIKLNIPEKDETVGINKEVTMNRGKKIVNTDNEKIKLVKGTRIDNKYILEIEYIENQRDKDELNQVMAYKKKLVGNDEIVLSKSSIDDDFNNIYTIEFDLNRFEKNINLKFSPVFYFIKGNWEYVIE